MIDIVKGHARIVCGVILRSARLFSLNLYAIWSSDFLVGKVNVMIGVHAFVYI